jgi:outer membrane scaffolding protein for murein synthesis (MipA/OmpV family)
MARSMKKPGWVAAALLAGAEATAQTASAVEPEAAEPGPVAAEPARRWAAAAGAVASVGPEFAGASRIGVNVQPGFAVRWGRVSLASRSAFAVRSEGAAAQGGLRVELVRSARWRSSLGLRWDSGRDEGASEDLRGLGDVRGTLRVRLSLGYRFDGGWRAGTALTTDALGRGGGWQGEVNAGRDWRLSPATTVGAGASMGFGGSRWQQNYFGITPEQSANSGYAVYTPGAGLRDVGLSLGGRTELGSRWAVFYGSSVSRLVGPSAASPLVRDRNGWGLSLGVVRRL